MKMINQFFAFCLFATLSVTALAADLTRSQVDAFISRADVAINNFDADTLIKDFSDNVKITFNFHFHGQTQVMQPSKAEYVALLKEGWAQLSNYQYSRSNLNVELQGKRAVITCDITESMDVNGQHLETIASEEVTVELINGKILVTSMVGHIDI